MTSPRLEKVHLTWASVHAAGTGLLGYVSARYGDLVLDGIAVRRTADGRLVLSWPARRDRAGRDHALVRPLDDAARRALERAIFAELGLTALEHPVVRGGDEDRPTRRDS